MNADHFITGSYVSWLALGIIVTTLSLLSWWETKSERRPATFFAIGIFFVWAGASLILRPSILYIRYLIQYTENAIPYSTDHPALLLGSVMALVGGNFLVCGFTWHRHGYRSVALSVAVTVCAFATGAWASLAGWL